MISQAPIGSKPISIITEVEIKDIYYFVNDCRTVVVEEEPRTVVVEEEPRTVYVEC